MYTNPLRFTTPKLSPFPLFFLFEIIYFTCCVPYTMLFSYKIYSHQPLAHIPSSQNITTESYVIYFMVRS